MKSRCPTRKNPTASASLILLLLLFGLLFGIGAAASAETMAKHESPYARANNSWITISGTVHEVTADRFELDYGGGVVTVEMDDGDRDADGYKLLPGDTVTVNGRIDADLYESTKIEAGSVYVEKLGTSFYASAMDEEDVLFYIVDIPAAASSAIVRGTVTDVGDEGFTIDTGERTVKVGVSSMPYDPLDDEGYQKIEKGDFVRVSGRIDDAFFEGRKLMADVLVKLSS